MYTTISPVYRYITHCTSLLTERTFAPLCSYETWRKEEGISDYTQDDDIMDGTEWLSHALLRVVPFTEEVYETMERLFGEKSPSDWGVLFGSQALCGHSLCTVPFPTVQWLVERGVTVDWNTPRAGYPALYRAISTHDGIAYIRFLIANGANPNISCGNRCGNHTSRSTPILTFYVAMELSSPALQDTADFVKRVECLLEVGADPLLEDYSGRTVIDLLQDVHRYTNVPRRLQQELLERMKRYA